MPAKMLWCLACLVAFQILPRLGLACSVCFGNPDDAQTQGMKYAILGLLGFTVVMLGSMGAFFVYLRRRSRLVDDLPLIRLDTPENERESLS